MSEKNVAYEEIAGQTFPATKDASGAATIAVPIETAQKYLSAKPLRRPARNRLNSTDHADIELARQRANEPVISFPDLRKELGL